MHSTTLIATIFLLVSSGINAFSVNSNNNNNRRAFIEQISTATIASVTAGVSSSVSSLAFPQIANAAPEIVKTASGVKYAITKAASNGIAPLKGDIVAIEYTGYLSNGQVR